MYTCTHFPALFLLLGPQTCSGGRRDFHHHRWHFAGPFGIFTFLFTALLSECPTSATVRFLDLVTKTEPTHLVSLFCKK